MLLLFNRSVKNRRAQKHIMKNSVNLGLLTRPKTKSTLKLR